MTEATSKKLVVSLIKGMNQSKKLVQSINGELGAEIKDAAENKDIHPGALKLVARLVRMNGDKSAAFVEAFYAYVRFAEDADMFGYRHVGDLVEQAEGAPPTNDEFVAKFDQGNVRDLRSGIKGVPVIVDDDPLGVGEAPADVA